MTSARDPEPPDLAFAVVRTLVLYSLAEFQAGHARTIRVVADGTSFSVSDDGRGHAIDRTVAESPYLKFIYTHFEYPFASGQDAPVQLQGIGMSLANVLCSELAVTVRKPAASLRLTFREGRLDASQRVDAKCEATGTTVAGKIAPGLQQNGISVPQLREWLRRVVSAHPAVKLTLNDDEVQAGNEDDA